MLFLNPYLIKKNKCTFESRPFWYHATGARSDISGMEA